MDQHVRISHVVRTGDFKIQDSIIANISTCFNRLGLDVDNTGEGFISQQMIIDSVWSDRVSTNSKLYNGTKFRLHKICDQATTGCVEMQLGITDYKEYLGTNWAPNVRHLQQTGLQLHGNSQAFLSDPLGVGALVQTNDNCMILLKRSIHCGEAQNQWDVPGGHPEPNELVGNLKLSEIDVASMNSSEVVKEIFNSILREVVDEVNIPLNKLAAPLYLGTAQNTTSACRPSIVFKIKCELSTGEVQTLYQQGSQSEAEESTNISFVSLDSLPSLQTTNKDLWDHLAPSAKGVVTVYCISHGYTKF